MNGFLHILLHKAGTVEVSQVLAAIHGIAEGDAINRNVSSELLCSGRSRWLGRLTIGGAC